jgi:hypothetical protein
MGSRLYYLVIDTHDLRALARFWAAVLGQPILFADDEEVIVGSTSMPIPGCVS